MPRVRSNRLVISLALLTTVLMACGAPPASDGGAGGETAGKPAAVETVYAADSVHRGQYLVRIGSCNDCHTPWVFDEELGMPVPDMTRMLSGHPEGGPDPQGTLGQYDIALIGPTFTSFTLPFGTMYAANITPDLDTGTGSWTEQMFLDIFRKGRHLGGDGRGVLPPMPWPWIRNLTDEDLKAVFAYLRSIPPIRNAVPEHRIPDEVVWQLRDSFDRFVTEMPQETWAAGKAE